MNGIRSRSKVTVLDEKPDKRNLTLFEYPQERCDDRPRGEITFTQHDANQLQSPRFLNDTIISFFMQYHWDKKVPNDEMKSRIHVFNSFFFAKLKAIRSSQNVSYQCLSRWLKDVKVFEKDFLIMPVCDRDHWILVIVCYAERIPSAAPQVIPDEDLKEPAVLVLNSFSGHAPSVKRTLNQFLSYQWHVERDALRKFPIEDAKRRGLRLIFPKLPQQKNSYNCGVYLLNFFYCFLKDPRKSYIRMYRKKDMSRWFEENKVDIKTERNRMTVIIKKQKILWSDSVNNSTNQSKDQEDAPTEISNSSQGGESTVEMLDTEEVTSNGSVIVIH